MLRIDTHHHAIPTDYRNLLRKEGIDEAGGRAVPEWSPEGSLKTMSELGVGTAILSVSTPATTFLPNPADAAALARDLNDYLATVVAAHPDRFGFFATVPMPHVDESVAEVVRSLDELHADGVVLLANAAGVYLGQDGQDDLFAALDARSAVAFIHPAELTGPRGRRCSAVRDGLPARYHPSGVSACPQRDSAQVPQHPVHPQPRRRIRALRLAPDGGQHLGRHRAKPGRQPG